MKDARVLITGGLGFIGSNLARRLIAMGACVTIVDSLNPDHGGNWHNLDGIKDQVQVSISDVRDFQLMRSLVQGQDFLFNLAGQTSHLDSMRDPLRDLENNCSAQLSVLEACRHHNPAIRVIYASTRQIYGRPNYLPVDESHPLRPVDINGVHKLAGELYHRIYRDTYGLWTCSMRLTNIYGPRMRIKDDRQTFLGTWIRCVLQGKPFEVWQGNQRRDLVYVDDALEAFLLAAASDKALGKTFNVADRTVTNLKDLAALLVRSHSSGSYTVCPFPPERKQIDIGDYYGDGRLIEEVLGWHPCVSLEEGISRTLEYYRGCMQSYL